MYNTIKPYEQIIKRNHNEMDVLKHMEKIAKAGQNNHLIKDISRAAAAIPNKQQRAKFILDSVYNLAVFRETPKDRQQLRSIENIIREQKANCTGYSTLLSAILLNLNEPHYFKLVDTKGNGFDHVYVITKNNIFDAVLGQKQNGHDTFENRQPAQLDNETQYFNYKIYPMITQINGRVTANRRNMINGYFEDLALGIGLILGDECKRECDIKYVDNYTLRQECKNKCALQPVNNDQLRYYGSGTVSINTLLLAGAGIGLTALILNSKKNKK